MNSVKNDKHSVSDMLYCMILVLITLCSFVPAAVLSKQQREDAFKKNPSDHRAKYHWALVAPCSISVRLYKEIAAAANSSDTLKAAACNALGEYCFVRKEYRMAAEHYKSSLKYISRQSVRDRWALALFCDGQHDAALTLWNALSLENKKEYAITADFYSGCAQLHKGNYSEALRRFEKCGEPDFSKPYTVEALSGRHLCLVKSGQQKDAEIFSKQLKQFPGYPLDWSSFSAKFAKSAEAATESVPEKKEIPSENGSNEFTVQVGAFSAIENASALQEKLSRQFKNVEVATVTLDEKTFYRVRVGSFATREKAELFAADSVLKAGFTGKAVPKKIADQN